MIIMISSYDEEYNVYFSLQTLVHWLGHNDALKDAKNMLTVKLCNKRRESSLDNL